MNNYQTPHSQQGVALISSLLIVGVLLSILFSLSAIFIPKIRIATETKNSVVAAYAAESGLEWCLYKNRVDPDAPVPSMGEGVTFEVTDCTISPIKSIGKYRGVTRSFEVSF